MWRSSTLLSARSFCSARSRPRRRPQGRRGRHRPPPFNAALPYSCRARASAKPKKGQHDKNDDNHTDDPEDIVHSCLPSFGKWSRLTDTVFDDLVAHVAPDHRAGYYSPRRSPGALTQISNPEKFTRRSRRGEGGGRCQAAGRRPTRRKASCRDAVGGLKDTRSARPAPAEENLAGRVPDSHRCRRAPATLRELRRRRRVNRRRG